MFAACDRITKHQSLFPALDCPAHFLHRYLFPSFKEALFELIFRELFVFPAFSQTLFLTVSPKFHNPWDSHQEKEEATPFSFLYEVNIASLEVLLCPVTVRPMGASTIAIFDSREDVFHLTS